MKDDAGHGLHSDKPPPEPADPATPTAAAKEQRACWEFLRQLSTRKLAPPVLHALEGGPQRYTDLHDRTTRWAGKAIHPQTLTATLRWLHAKRYIAHRDQPTPEYRLTPDGRHLAQTITEFEHVSRRHLRDRPQPTADDEHLPDTHAPISSGRMTGTVSRRYPPGVTRALRT